MTEVVGTEIKPVRKIQPDRIVTDALSLVGDDFIIPKEIDPKAVYVKGVNKQLAI